jgi:hypothetical protein
VDFKFHNLDFERFGVEQNHLSGSMKSRYRNKPHLLSGRSINDCGVVSRLIAHEIDVRTFFNNKLIFVLERVAP